MKAMLIFTFLFSSVLLSANCVSQHEEYQDPGTEAAKWNPANFYFNDCEKGLENTITSKNISYINLEWGKYTRWPNVYGHPDLITQHQCLTSLMTQWEQILWPGSKVFWKVIPEEWKLSYSSMLIPHGV